MPSQKIQDETIVQERKDELEQEEKKYRIGQQPEALAPDYPIRKCGANPALTLRAAV